MLLGHVLAALAAGWLLRRGDLALARLVELSAHSAHSVAEAALVRALRAALSLVHALHAGLAGVPGTGPRLPHTARLAPPRPRTTALQHTVIRRGPPSDALALAALTRRDHHPAPASSAAVRRGRRRAARARARIPPVTRHRPSTGGPLEAE